MWNRYFSIHNRVERHFNRKGEKTMNTIIDCVRDFYSKPENMDAYQEWLKEEEAREKEAVMRNAV